MKLNSAGYIVDWFCTLPARASRSLASEFKADSETPHVLRWPLISLLQSPILTTWSVAGRSGLAPQSPPTYFEYPQNAMPLNEPAPRLSPNSLDLNLFSFSLQTKKSRIVNPETTNAFYVVNLSRLVSLLKPTYIPKFETPVNIRTWTWTHFHLIMYQINEESWRKQTDFSIFER